MYAKNLVLWYCIIMCSQNTYKTKVLSIKITKFTHFVELVALNVCWDGIKY